MLEHHPRLRAVCRLLLAQALVLLVVTAVCRLTGHTALGDMVNAAYLVGLLIVAAGTVTVLNHRGGMDDHGYAFGRTASVQSGHDIAASEYHDRQSHHSSRLFLTLLGLTTLLCAAVVDAYR